MPQTTALKEWCLAVDGGRATSELMAWLSRRVRKHAGLDASVAFLGSAWCYAVGKFKREASA